MPGGGTRTFLEPDHYEASLGQAQIEAVILSRDKFRARLTWAELHHLHVLRCEEESQRIAYVQLAPGLAFVTLSPDSGPLPVLCGTQMHPGEIIFHSRGERLHQATPGPFVWNVIAMDPAQLEYYGRALSGTPFSLPPEGRILRPSKRLTAGLQRLHARICRLAETKPKILSHSEVARAIEQGLVQMLVTCLTTASARTDGYAKRPSCQDHGQVRGGPGGTPRPASGAAGILHAGRGERPDLSVVLCRISRHEPRSECAVASVEGSPPRAARR